MSSRLGISTQSAVRSRQLGAKIHGASPVRAVASRFQDLVAYRMAAALADDLHGTVADWPSFDRWSLGIQLVRSADSVGANIAEGIGRASARDQRRMLVIARGSLFELEHWTTRAGARGLLDAGSYGTRIEELARTLAGLLRSIRAS